MSNRGAPSGGSEASGRSGRRRRRAVVGSLGTIVVVVAIAVALLTTGSGGARPPAKRPTGTARKSAASIRRAAAEQIDPANSRTSLGRYGEQASWVVAENKLPGTKAWHIWWTPKTGSIQGFANLTYAAVGDEVKLYVSSTAARFRVQAFRMGYYGGDGGRLIWTSPAEEGHVQPTCPVTPGTNMVSCDNWTPSLTLRVTSAFLPGDYLLKLTGTGHEQSYIQLTIWQPSSHAAYLIMNRSFTEEGWNAYGGYSYYQGEGPCPPGSGTYPVCNRARVVSFDRPYDSGNGASDFLSNEYPLVRFCEQHGLDVTYATDVTLDQHPAFLLQQRALLSLGHDESWSLNEREAAQTAEQHGVNLVFFGAASVLRHVRPEPSPLGPDREVVDYRDSAEDPLDGKANPLEVTGNTWGSPPTDLPESGLVGEMYAGYLEPGTPSFPFVVADASAWIFKGTGLHDGSELPGLMESDFDHVAPSYPMPADLQVLGHSPLPLSDVQTDLGAWGRYTYSDMTYYTDAKSDAGVLDTGDNNWINALTPCPAHAAECVAGTVAKITGNLLRLFGQGPAGRIVPSVSNWKSITPAGS